MSENKPDERHAAERRLILSGYRYALSLTHHEQDAEDLVQQACLKIFRVRRQLREKAYLLKAIRNLFYDSHRRRQAVDFASLSESAVVDPSPNPTRIVDGKLDTAQLLGALSSEEREMLYLNCVERFTAEEIGAITGKPRGTVLSQLSRAKQKVKQQKEQTPMSEETV